MHRFFILPQSIVNNTCLICPPEYHHIINVLRYKKGDNIMLFDGKGREYKGLIESVDYDKKNVSVLLTQTCREETKRPLILVQSLLKTKRMDIVIEKATELGVTHIYPVATRNNVVKLEDEKSPAKLNKWQRIAKEAGKQCQTKWIPHIDKIWELDEAVSSLSWVETKIICTPKGKGMRDIKDEKPLSTALMIGPEGDFTDEELFFACQKGWTPVKLGETIMRAETAAISVLGILCYKFGYWQ